MTNPTKYNACRDVKGKICRAEFVSGPDNGLYKYRIIGAHQAAYHSFYEGQTWCFNSFGAASGIDGPETLQLLHIPEQDDLTALAAIAERRNPAWKITYEIPEPVDEADLQEARECAALVFEEVGQPNWPEEIRRGDQDDLTSVQSVLTYIKRNREASQ